jgi:uncharacterized protein YjbK
MKEVSLEVAEREIGATGKYKPVTIEDVLKKMSVKMNEWIDTNKRKVFHYNSETKNGYLIVKYGNQMLFALEEDAASADEAKDKFRVFLNDLASGKITDGQKKKVEEAIEVMKKRLEKNRAARKEKAANKS